MNIRINKDFLTEYKEDFWKGFSLKESVSIFAGAAIGIAGAAGAHFLTGIRIDTAVYIGVPMALPAIFLGFYRYQGYLVPGRFLSEMMETSRSKDLSYQVEDLPPRRVFFIDRNLTDKGKRRRGDNGTNY